MQDTTARLAASRDSQLDTLKERRAELVSELAAMQGACESAEAALVKENTRIAFHNAVKIAMRRYGILEEQYLMSKADGYEATIESLTRSNLGLQAQLDEKDRQIDNAQGRLGKLRWLQEEIRKGLAQYAADTNPSNKAAESSTTNLHFPNVLVIDDEWRKFVDEVNPLEQPSRQRIDIMELVNHQDEGHAM